ncbi:TolC family protein [Psychroflexus salis]|uniref:Transporter n=1 Tax=Psychroflexus salis TaxID=1526574 RepID=A0A917E5R2_9FLAO|nr:TolC family protein [Psychroflexus salis]GGE03278.1 transporter [Psychroflexus salis]
MYKKYIIVVIVMTGFLGFSQAENKKSYQFSLEEAIAFAVDSSYNAINARKDVLAAMKQKWETTADGLPQINANVDYQYNPVVQVTPLPAELTGGEPGTFVPVQFSPRQNMNATATLNQLIFDGSYIVALRAAKTFLRYSANFEEKTQLEVRKAVVDAYGNVLLMEESIAIIERNLANAESNFKETKAVFENGLAEEEDVEQLEITLIQLENELRNAQRNHEITKETLNFVLGIPIDITVELTDDLTSLAQLDLMAEDLLEEDLALESNIDFKIAENLVQQRELEWKLEQSKALPTLSAFANYGYIAFGEEFNFFNSQADWFDFSTVGVSLNVPIFSSLRRSARSQRAEIALEQAETELTQSTQQIKLETNRAKSDFKYATETYITSQRNLDLAERIEHKNDVKFKEGIATSFELRQAQQQLYTAQNEYLQAMLNIITAKAELETVLNKPVIK